MENETFMVFAELVAGQSPLQKKAINAFLSRQDRAYWQDANAFADNMLSLLDAKGLSPAYVADAYLKICKDMLRQQMLFKRAGVYSCTDSKHAFENVYSSETEMASYMYGLALSQFLWPNHYAIFKFFKQTCRLHSNATRYLEIGPGHGVYLAEAMNIFKNTAFSAVDISPVSLRISKEVVDHFTRGKECDFIVNDVRNFSGEAYDFLCMCEVLEHLDETIPLLEKLYSMTAENGRVFITTCANCPAVDHTYLYDSVGHIRNELRAAGFSIERELVLGVGDIPESEWDVQKAEINYAAVLVR
ncbi:class I SAM-dependent methyltransferase [Fundidesulfovibrio butyratiphilus]